MHETGDKLILELVEAIDEQHEMITFLLGLLPKTDNTPEIHSALERIQQKIKHVKNTRIAAILVRQKPKQAQEN